MVQMDCALLPGLLAEQLVARSHPEITGSILRRDKALRAGINEFGTLLRPAYSDASA